MVDSAYWRRFARHKTFMYLLYDVIQLRKSSMGNAVLVKRQNWQSATDDIASLTVSQLQDAAKAVATGQTIDDPIIGRLLRNIEAIGMQVPGSFAQKLRMRSEIRGLIARYGMPAFWITINPSGLRNPLVLILAGVEYSGNDLATVNATIREATATSNPVAVAKFSITSVKPSWTDSSLPILTGSVFLAISRTILLLSRRTVEACCTFTD